MKVVISNCAKPGQPFAWAALMKAWDKQAVAVYEAAIKLGEAAKTPSGQCAANVARVHLNLPISNY